MNRRDIVIGVIILAALGAVIYFTQKPDQVLPEATPTPRSQEAIEGDIEGSFNVEIPEDAERAFLEGTNGTEASARATRELENGATQFTVLADLPEPDENAFYQVWVENDEEEIAIGTMRVAKGGYLLEVSLEGETAEFDDVVVSREIVNDSEIEERVLQGSFQN